MTYAPDDLKAVQRYCQTVTGQPWASLGIIHSTPQGGGYHEGRDLLHRAGTAPEDPGSDYSYTESQRDRNGLTDAGSAFDLGGNFPRFYEFNRWIVGRCQAKDPRCRDIREVIHTLDGRTVRRWDALGRRTSGDDSHLTHSHISFFRDSDGRRDDDTNFLGLLREFFEGKKVQTVDPIQEALMAIESDFPYLAWRVESLFFNRDKVAGGPDKGQTVPLVAAIKDIQASQSRLSAELAAIKAMVSKLSQPVVNVDASVLAAELAKLLPQAPTAEQNAAEIAKRLGNG